MSATHLHVVAHMAPAARAAANEPVIETRALELRYGRKTALHGLTLSIPRGRINAIIGANGAGKSSLFSVLLGFTAPTSGSARILGRDCRALGADDRARIGFVNEEHSLPGWLRVGELVSLQRSLYPRWNEKRYREVAGHFNVLPTQRIRELSRGERAGVNLAMALAQQPEILILDEPTLGLDVVAKRAFLETVLASVDATGSTIVYCSHQMEEIERLADNLLILERGELRHMSAPDEFCERVSLWVVDFAFVPPDLATLPGVLEVQRFDSLWHVLALDRDDNFATELAARGARRSQRGAVNLGRAVNAFLTRNHAAPQREPRHA